MPEAHHANSDRLPDETGYVALTLGTFVPSRTHRLMRSVKVVTIGGPAEHFVSMAFQDISILLQLSLRSLGYDCELRDSVFDPTSLNIVLGYHLLPDAEQLRRHQCIVYQLEHLQGQHRGWLMLDDRKAAILRAAQAVWDFSALNIAFLAANGIDGVKHVPIGFHEEIKTVDKTAIEDIDIFFYGAINVRRKKILDELARCCRVKASFGIYGARRDHFIARSKIVLNLRSGPTSIMEQPRVSYLLNNGQFVVTEDAADNPYDDAVVAVPYDSVVDCCLRYLADDDGRKRMAERGYSFLAERPMVEYLRRVLY